MKKEFKDVLKERYSAFTALVVKAVSDGQPSFTIGGVTFTVSRAGTGLEDLGWYIVNGQRVSLCERRADRLAVAALGFLGADLVRRAEELRKLKADDIARGLISERKKRPLLNRLRAAYGDAWANKIWASKLKLANPALKPVVVTVVKMVMASGAPVDGDQKAAKAVCHRLPKCSNGTWEMVRTLAGLLRPSGKRT